MIQRVLTQGILLSLLAGVSTGCHKPAVQEKPAPDPLLTSKKPVEGRPHPLVGPLAENEEIPLPPPPPAEVDSLPLRRGNAPGVWLLGARPVQSPVP